MMIAAPLPAPSPPCWAATDPVDGVPATPPLRPNLERLKYQQPRQRQRPPFQQKHPEKDKRKPDDEHKVDDYA